MFFFESKNLQDDSKLFTNQVVSPPSPSELSTQDPHLCVCCSEIMEIHQWLRTSPVSRRLGSWQRPTGEMYGGCCWRCFGRWHLEARVWRRGEVRVTGRVVEDLTRKSGRFACIPGNREIHYKTGRRPEIPGKLVGRVYVRLQMSRI